MSAHDDRSAHTDGDALALETRDLRKSFAGFDAVAGVDLKVRKGSVHALLGPNGAGKTTLFNLLSGMLRSTSGSIHLAGTDVTGWSPDRIARLGVGRSFQVTRLFPEFTCREHVQLTLLAGTSLAWRPLASRRRLDAHVPRADELLEEVGLTADRFTHAASLAYGKRRALEIAIALARDPHLLLLDEPTAGMGLQDVERTVQLVSQVAKGRTVVLVEHNMKVVSSLADRVTVLQAGAILAEGSYQDVRADARVIQAYLGGAHASHERD